MSAFDRRDGRLVADGCDLAEVAERFGTPLYVYSRGAIEHAYRAYAEAFASVPHRVCYALKANGNGSLLRLLAGLGAGADIVSGFELQAALRAGFTPDRIAFAGVGKTDDELRAALAAGIGEFNCESEGEIERLSELASAQGRRAPIGVRLNPDIDPKSHPYISTGLRDSKFGIDIADGPAVLAWARQLPGIEVVGLQCHIGSQIGDLLAIEQAARELARLSKALLDQGFGLRSIDVGGGLSIDYEERGLPGPAELAARLLPQVAGLGLELVLEPGRSLIGPAGALLTRVLYLKRKSAKRFVIVDAGMNDLLRPALYEAHHRIEPAVDRHRPGQVVDVVGPVCETGDFLALDRSLPEVEPGELLVVRDAGAYGFAMTSNYNLRPRPAEVLLEQGAARLIRRRETFDDLILTEQGC